MKYLVFVLLYLGLVASVKNRFEPPPKITNAMIINVNGTDMGAFNLTDLESFWSKCSHGDILKIINYENNQTIYTFKDNETVDAVTNIPIETGTTVDPALAAVNASPTGIIRNVTFTIYNVEDDGNVENVTISPNGTTEVDPTGEDVNVTSTGIIRNVTFTIYNVEDDLNVENVTISTNGTAEVYAVEDDENVENVTISHNGTTEVGASGENENGTVPLSGPNVTVSITENTTIDEPETVIESPDVNETVTITGDDEVFTTDVEAPTLNDTTLLDVEIPDAKEILIVNDTVTTFEEDVITNITEASKTNDTVLTDDFVDLIPNVIEAPIFTVTTPTPYLDVLVPNVTDTPAVNVVTPGVNDASTTVISPPNLNDTIPTASLDIVSLNVADVSIVNDTFPAYALNDDVLIVTEDPIVSDTFVTPGVNNATTTVIPPPNLNDTIPTASLDIVSLNVADAPNVNDTFVTPGVNDASTTVIPPPNLNDTVPTASLDTVNLNVTDAPVVNDIFVTPGVNDASTTVIPPPNLNDTVPTASLDIVSLNVTDAPVVEDTFTTNGEDYVLATVTEAPKINDTIPTAAMDDKVLNITEAPIVNDTSALDVFIPHFTDAPIGNETTTIGGDEDFKAVLEAPILNDTTYWYDVIPDVTQAPTVTAETYGGDADLSPVLEAPNLNDTTYFYDIIQDVTEAPIATIATTGYEADVAPVLEEPFLDVTNPSNEGVTITTSTAAPILNNKNTTEERVVIITSTESPIVNDKYINDTTNMGNPVLLEGGTKMSTDDLKIEVVCFQHYIQLNIIPKYSFSGLIFPIITPFSYICSGKYVNTMTNFTYRIPLKACHTEKKILSDGLQYSNTIVIQPHLALHTKLGTTYKLICHYPSYIQTIESAFNVNSNSTVHPKNELERTAVPPRLLMRFYHGNKYELASDAVVGETLAMVIAMENYEVYYVKVINCFMHDGAGYFHKMIDENGCLIDFDVMSPFTYSADRRFVFGEVTAFKFFFSDIVHFKCDVIFCTDPIYCGDVPPKCHLPPAYLNRSEADREEEEKLKSFYFENAENIVNDHFNSTDSVTPKSSKKYQEPDELKRTYMNNQTLAVLNHTYVIEYTIVMHRSNSSEIDDKYTLPPTASLVGKTSGRKMMSVNVSTTPAPMPADEKNRPISWDLVGIDIFLVAISTPIIIFFLVCLYKGYQRYRKHRSNARDVEEGLEMRDLSVPPPITIPRVRSIGDSIRRSFRRFHASPTQPDFSRMEEPTYEGFHSQSSDDLYINIGPGGNVYYNPGPGDDVPSNSGPSTEAYV